MRQAVALERHARAGSMRSVWSRLEEPARRRVVEPAASIPAISTHDFTWALGDGQVYSIPVSSRRRAR